MCASSLGTFEKTPTFPALLVTERSGIRFEAQSQWRILILIAFFAGWFGRPRHPIAGVACRGRSDLCHAVHRLPHGLFPCDSVLEQSHTPDPRLPVSSFTAPS